MQPTPGRVVLYRPNPTQLGFFSPDPGGLVPAIVTGANPGGTTNLIAFSNAGGGSIGLLAVAEGTEPGTWQWPARVADPVKPAATTPLEGRHDDTPKQDRKR